MSMVLSVILNKKVLLAADSNNMSSELYDYIFDEIGKIDVLFLGMECDGAPLSWLYGSLLSSPIKRSMPRISDPPPASTSP